MKLNPFIRPLGSRLAEIESMWNSAPSKEEGSARVLAFASSSEIAALVRKVIAGRLGRKMAEKV